jgi:hypothetical protein
LTIVKRSNVQVQELRGGRRFAGSRSDPELRDGRTGGAGQMSDGPKTVFGYGKQTAKTRDGLNANTVTVITGTIGGTYVQIGADLASVLDDGDKLRILPIGGRGSIQAVADILS